MSLNIAYVTPRILGFEQVINEIFETHSIRNSYGDQSYVSKSKPLLKIDIGFVDPSGDINSGESYIFDSEDGVFSSVQTVLSSSGVDVKAAWELAFDSAKEMFLKTKDQGEDAKKTGIAWYMRVDSVKANLNPKGSMGISMTIGCYKDQNFTKVASMFEIGFFDSQTIVRKLEQVNQLQSNIQELEKMANGIHESQVNLNSNELEKSKVRAANDLAINKSQLSYYNNTLSAPLSSVLSLPAVQEAFVAVAQSVFLEFKSKLPEWSEINVAELMKLFVPAMRSLVLA